MICPEQDRIKGDTRPECPGCVCLNSTNMSGCAKVRLGHPLTFGYQHQMHRLLKLILLSKKSLLRSNCRGRSNLDLGQLTSKKLVFREFRDKFAKLSVSYFWLLFAPGRQRQQNLRKRPQVAAIVGGDLDLLDPYFLVAMDSSEAEEESLDSWQTSDDVIRRAQAKIGQ